MNELRRLAELQKAAGPVSHALERWYFRLACQATDFAALAEKWEGMETRWKYHEGHADCLSKLLDESMKSCDAKDAEIARLRAEVGEKEQ